MLSPTIFATLLDVPDPAVGLMRDRVNVAVTECAASIVTMQVPVPVQPPVQPVKSEPPSGSPSG